MIVYANVFVYVCMYPFIYVTIGQIIKNHSCGRMIAYVGKWNEEVPSYEELSGKSSHDKYMRSVSCEYEITLYAWIMTMLMLWTHYT